METSSRASAPPEPSSPAVALRASPAPPLRAAARHLDRVHIFCPLNCSYQIHPDVTIPHLNRIGPDGRELFLQFRIVFRIRVLREKILARVSFAQFDLLAWPNSP